MKNKFKLYLCHIDERDSAVVLPHASSSSQPEVKVHASVDPCTSEHALCLFEVSGLPSKREECVWKSLIVKYSASCVQTSSNLTTLPRPVLLSHTSGKETTLKGTKAARAGNFLIPISHPPLARVGTLCHGNRNLSCQSEGGDGRRHGDGHRERFKGMNECGNVELWCRSLLPDSLPEGWTHSAGRRQHF